MNPNELHFSVLALAMLLLLLLPPMYQLGLLAAAVLLLGAAIKVGHYYIRNTVTMYGLTFSLQSCNPAESFTAPLFLSS